MLVYALTGVLCGFVLALLVLLGRNSSLHERVRDAEMMFSEAVRNLPQLDEDTQMDLSLYCKKWGMIWTGDDIMERQS